jgi:two-component system, chemotaxis family, response regulator Rcp1
VMDGRAVLAEIFVDPALRHLAVIVLTTSAADKDILQMYKLRCSSYIIKPVGFENFAAVVAELGDYWFNLVVLPTRVATLD